MLLLYLLGEDLSAFDMKYTKPRQLLTLIYDLGYRNIWMTDDYEGRLLRKYD
jgi:hypothetical protein